MTAREAIVTALGTVPGLAPSVTNPQAPTPGAAWPRWVTTNYQNGKLCALAVPDYDVYIVLPNDVAEETVESADGLLPAIAAALGRVGTVISAQPVAIQLDDSSTMPGLRVRLTPRKKG